MLITNMEEYVYIKDDFVWSRSKRSEISDQSNPTSDWLLDSGDAMMGITTTSSGLDNNTMSNDTDVSNTTTRKPYYYQKGQLTFLSLLFVLIVVGNVSVLVAISLSKKRKSRMNFFIMHLAFADLTSGIATVLPDIIWRSTVQWYADTSLCKIFKYLQSVPTFGSTYVLVALSIDRLDAIARPMNFSGSGTRAKILVGVAWGLSMLFSLPMLVLNEVALTKSKNRQCMITILPQWGWQLYLTLLSVVLFIIPAIIICACYSIIVNIIWRKSGTTTPRPPRQIAIFTRRNGQVQNGAQQNDCRSQESHTSGRGVIPKARIKTIKMTLVIVFAFVICWSPYFVYNLLAVYNLIPLTSNMTAVSTFVQSLSSLNSGVNSIIYCLFSTRICQNWRRLPYCDWFARTFCSCCNPDGGTNHPPGFATSGTDFTSVVTDGRGHSRAVNNGRRHSGTPYVKVTLSEKDNEILLRHIKTPEHKTYTNNGDTDNISENISSV